MPWSYRTLHNAWTARQVSCLNVVLEWWEKYGRNVRAAISRRVKTLTEKLPDSKFYRPHFSPWLGHGEFLSYLPTSHSVLTKPKLYHLYSLFMQSTTVLGDVVECGVYQGGTASMLARLIADKAKNKHLHLFDTFTGIPVCDPDVDCHHVGDFGDTNLDQVKTGVGHADIVRYHVGIMPQTFTGLENVVVSFVHVDVDMYQSYVDCLAFFWPRLSPGGIMVFDDYGHQNCPGARKAVDEFFADKPEKAISLFDGQAFAIKLR